MFDSFNSVSISDNIVNPLVTDSTIVSHPAVELITALTGSLDTKITFSCFPEGELKAEGKNNPKNFYGSFEECQNDLEALNKSGYGIFLTIQETHSIKRTKNDIGRTRAFFVDMDYEGLPKDIHLQPSLIVESSPKKHHLYWFLSEYQKLSNAEFKSHISPLIKRYKSDNACCDLPRVLRLPGFIHKKTDSGFVTRIAVNNNIKYPLSAFPPQAKTVIKKVIEKPLKSIETVDNLVQFPGSEEGIDEAYKARIEEEINNTIPYLKTLLPGKRMSTINKKYYYLGGLTSSIPDMYDYALDEGIKMIDEMCFSGKWDNPERVKKCMEDALAAGSEKPCKLPEIGKPSKSNIAKTKIKLWLKTEGDLEWNEMALRIEIDRKAVDTDTLRQRFQEWSNYDVAKETFKDIIVYIAQQHSYHGVREYLNSLPVCEKDDINDVWEALFVAMGITKNPEIQKQQVVKWLIAAAARALDPGCKVDNCLILKDPKQGSKKTSFFETLGGDFFQTAGNHGKEADEIMAYMCSWIIEMGEIENTFDKKGISALKAFLTKRWDIFRAPYAPAHATHQRHYLFCGTTNEDKFLADVSGNRRYWITDISQTINIPLLEEIRDDVWAAALALYKEGIIGYKENGKPIYVENLWWFNDADEELVGENTAQSSQNDSLEDEVYNLVTREGYEYFTLKMISTELCLTQTQQNDRRIQSILKALKISPPQNATRHNGVRARYWRHDEYWDKVSKDTRERQAVLKKAQEEEDSSF